MDDLISRQAVLALPRNITRNMFGDVVEETITVARVEEIPSVDAVPVRHGQWIRIGVPDIDGNQQYRCSVCECGELHAPSVKVSYCWNCGARMEENSD